MMISRYCSLVTFREGRFCEQSSQKTRELSLRSKRYFLLVTRRFIFLCIAEARVTVSGENSNRSLEAGPGGFFMDILNGLGI